MRHLLAAVVVSGDIFEHSGIARMVNDALDPFDNGRLVDPWESPCSCVGRDAVRWATDIVNTRDEFSREVAEEVRAKTRAVHLLAWSVDPTNTHAEATVKRITQHEGSVEQLRELGMWPPPDREAILAADDQLGDVWDNFNAAKAEAIDELARTHDGYGKPDPDCGIDVSPELRDDCGLCAGTGVYTTSRNPRGKWESWKIGGQFTAFFLRDEHGDLNADPSEIVGDPNVMTSTLYRDLIERRRVGLPFALVVGDEWMEEGASEREWRETVLSVLAAGPESLIVAVDVTPATTP